MKKGTPGFVSARLREGREARGLTAAALAESVGVTRAAVSQYELGKASPRPDVVERIAKALAFPVSFFMTERGSPLTEAIYYRSLSSATKTARTRAEHRLTWVLRDIVPFLSNYVRFPVVNFPEAQQIEHPSELRNEDIEYIASEVRRVWSLNDGAVISNVVWLLENQGAIVISGRTGAETLDSFSTWLDGRPYIYLGSDKHSATRSRFDAAHELGHLILHRNVSAALAARSSEHSLMEDQAHRFAGAFLAPAKGLAASFYTPTLNSFRYLKQHWLVSIAALIHRCQDIALISEDQAKRLWIAMARRGWRVREPLDDVIPVEEPRLLRTAFELVVSKHPNSRTDASRMLGLNEHDLEELCALPGGFLSDRPPPIELIDFHKPRTAQPPPPPSGRARIVTLHGASLNDRAIVDDD